VPGLPYVDVCDGLPPCHAELGGIVARTRSTWSARCSLRSIGSRHAQDSRSCSLFGEL
jgi:hypothetical protein